MFENHYVLITAGSCEFCQEAVEILKSKELNFIFTDMENAPQVLEGTKLASGHATVPMIWEVVVGEDPQSGANNNFIGGCDELKKHLGINDSAE